MSQLCVRLQEYSDRLEQQLPPVRQDARRGMETADLPLERVPAVCTTLCTAAYVRDNVPLLQRYIVERVAPASGEAGEASSAAAKQDGVAARDGPQPSANEDNVVQTPRASTAAGVTLESAVRAVERLEAAGLKVLDTGLMTQVARYIDGPLLPGPRIQVLAANIQAWKTEQVGARYSDNPMMYVACTHVNW